MIKATLEHEYLSDNPIIMEVLLKNNIAIKSNGTSMIDGHYFTCIFKDEDQLNQILLILAARRMIITVKHKRKLFDFKEFWKNLK